MRYESLDFMHFHHADDLLGRMNLNLSSKESRHDVSWHLIFGVTRTLREANQVADGLANFGLTLVACSRIFHSVPLSIISAAVRADCLCWDFFSHRFLGVLLLFWLGLSPSPPPKKKKCLLIKTFSF